jgi:ABC-type transport system substrate-binding protein
MALAKKSNQELFEATIGGRVVGSDKCRSGEDEGPSGVEVIDDYTLRIKLKKPNRSFLQILALPALGVIPEGSSDDISTGLIGAGPFALSSSKKDAVLIRNNDYFRKDEFGNRYPYLDTLRFVQIAKNTDRLEAFFNGEIDLVSSLELDPIRDVLETHVADFSGKNPKHVLKREVDNASYDTYSIYNSQLKGLGSGFMGYRDFTETQMTN